LTALADMILVTLALSCFNKPNFMKGRRRRSVNKIADLIKFVFSIKFSITLKKSIANRLDDSIIYTCAIHCFK
jgi:hypothetical protein